MVLFRATVTLVLFLLLYPLSAARSECDEPVARLASLQGQAELKAAGQSAWKPARTGERFCPGDLLTLGDNGRAAIVLTNDTILRLDRNSTVHFRLPERRRSIVELLRGALHIFSHRPRSLQVLTPYVNGSVEGTEFLVSVRPGQTEIIVFTGLVVAANDQGSNEISSGQAIIALDGAAPAPSLVARPRDAVQWTLYYPDIFKGSATISDRLAQIGNLLSTGQVVAARIDCEQILAAHPNNSEALAVLAVIELVQNNLEAAIGIAHQAHAADPLSAAAALAVSYVRQAAFDITGALQILHEAAASNPGNTLVSARLAELQLADGNRPAALEIAEATLSADPDNARAWAIRGFTALAGLATAQAQDAFTTAIALDEMLPLARLGLGLALIRDGEVRDGRAAIELAVALDPNSSLLRSYLGKAYYEERREKNAQRQYQLAKELDPADPTPWFYDALAKKAANRPVEALADLHASQTRNDNRAVYRSRFLLDDDLAARSASLGRIYQDLGFGRMALAEGWQSVAANPANHSAHRFLADTYSVLPRHEIARVSELLQSQLLQPLSIAPVQPQLAESDLLAMESSGPTQLSLAEFHPLFLRNRLSLQASGVVGSNTTFGDELTHAAIIDNISYSLGQFHYQSDGIRPNNWQRTNLVTAYLQAMVAPETSFLTEIRYKKQTFGDLFVRFDPSDYSATIDQSSEIATLRVGGRHDLGPRATLIGTAVIGNSDGSADGIEGPGASLGIDSAADTYQLEGQHLYHSERYRLQTGTGYLYADEHTTLSWSSPLDLHLDQDSTTRHANLYSYAQIDLAPGLLSTIGLSGDLLDSPITDREQLNPKFGITWQPLSSTVIRGAAFRSVNRRLIYAQTIEPTQIAGFNQFFNDFEASTASTYGAGIDHRLTSSLFAGLQFFRRDLDVPFLSVNETGTPEQAEDDWQETVGSAYLYWAPYSWLAAGIDYTYERFTHDRWEGPQAIRVLTTQKITPKIRLFHHSGLIVGLQASYLDQRGDFGWTGFGFISDRDRFWVTDLSIGYRLPYSAGMASLDIRNLFNETFRYLDTDPANPRLLPERQVVFRLTLSW